MIFSQVGIGYTLNLFQGFIFTAHLKYIPLINPKIPFFRQRNTVIKTKLGDEKRFPYIT